MHAERERQVNIVLRQHTVRGFKKLRKVPLDTAAERALSCSFFSPEDQPYSEMCIAQLRRLTRASCKRTARIDHVEQVASLFRALEALGQAGSLFYIDRGGLNREWQSKWVSMDLAASAAISFAPRWATRTSTSSQSTILPTRRRWRIF